MASRPGSFLASAEATAPFHWSGDMADLGHLMGEVFVRRMGGGLPTPEHVASVGRWLDAQPVLRAPGAKDATAVGRGRALFESSVVACAGCHSGPRFTNNITIDVGTGGSFQVPSLLGLHARAPYLHSGCAATLKDRFGSCGGNAHGKTSHLTPAQIDDLVAYLETL